MTSGSLLIVRSLNRRRVALMAGCVTALLLIGGPASAATVALWHMDETSGDTMTDSAGSNDGTLSDVSLGEPGIQGFAFGFNGTSSKVTVPHSSSLNPGTADVTLTANFNTTAGPASTSDLIRKGVAGGTYYKLELKRTRTGDIRARCYFRGSEASGQLLGGSNLSDGQWHNLVCTKSANSMHLTVDGVTRTRTKSLGSIENTSALTVGHKQDSTDFYQGTMDELSVQSGPTPPPDEEPTADETRTGTLTGGSQDAYPLSCPAERLRVGATLRHDSTGGPLVLRLQKGSTIVQKTTSGSLTHTFGSDAECDAHKLVVRNPGSNPTVNYTLSWAYTDGA